jgi:hypothetical protein
VRLEGLGQLKNPMTSSGIEPATFQLVAYCLVDLTGSGYIPVCCVLNWFNVVFSMLCTEQVQDSRHCIVY